MTITLRLSDPNDSSNQGPGGDFEIWINQSSFTVDDEDEVYFDLDFKDFPAATHGSLESNPARIHLSNWMDISQRTTSNPFGATTSIEISEWSTNKPSLFGTVQINNDSVVINEFTINVEIGNFSWSIDPQIRINPTLP